MRRLPTGKLLLDGSLTLDAQGTHCITLLKRTIPAQKNAGPEGSQTGALDRDV
jgi:hypothetical protein